MYSKLFKLFELVGYFRRAVLEELKQWLKQTPLRVLKYEKLLRDLEDHQNAIAINTENYRSRIDKI